MPEIAINIDVGRIKFVIRNVLKNGIEHSTGNIPVELLVTEKDAAVIITVKDSGPGIPEELLERVFDRFFRVESIKNRSFDGVGLGLFLCKRVVEAHQGELLVSNSPEGGCIFTLTLPIQ